MKPHKHADLIHAWADGAEIEVYSEISGQWILTKNPSFFPDMKYRIKPQPVVKEKYLGICGDSSLMSNAYELVSNWNNVLKLTYTDNKLTNVEIVK